MLNMFRNRKPRSRLAVGFYRLGIVLAAPFLAGATVLAALQWQNPTGPLVLELPVGTMGYGFGDNPDDVAKKIIAEQRTAGFDLPLNMIVVGLPLGKVRHDNADWTKFQLADGREIGIASTDSKKVSDIAREFLLAEKRAGRFFNDKDVISFQDVPVAFLEWQNQDPTVTPPWLHKRREWKWPLVALCIGLAVFVSMRALGWVIDGFVNSRSNA